MAYTISGRTFNDLIWQSLVFDGHLSAVPPTWERVELAQGASVLTPTVRQGPRGFRVTVELRPPSLVDRVATLDALYRRCAGVVPITSDDAPSRVWYARLSSATVELPQGNLVNPLCLVDLEFTAHDPRRFDLETQSRALSATPVACPTGTAVSIPPRLRLFGAATPVVDPVVQLLRFDGTVASELALKGSLGTDTYLDLDGATEWLYLVTAGVRTSGLHWLLSGAFPQLSGEDAASSTGPYPLLALRSASGTPTGVALWRRAW